MGVMYAEYFFFYRIRDKIIIKPNVGIYILKWNVLIEINTITKIISIKENISYFINKLRTVQYNYIFRNVIINYIERNRKHRKNICVNIIFAYSQGSIFFS